MSVSERRVGVTCHQSNMDKRGFARHQESFSFSLCNLKSLCYHQNDHQNQNHQGNLWATFEFFLAGSNISTTFPLFFVYQNSIVQCNHWTDRHWNFLGHFWMMMMHAVSPSRDIGSICLQSRCYYPDLNRFKSLGCVIPSESQDINWCYTECAELVPQSGG